MNGIQKEKDCDPRLNGCLFFSIKKLAREFSRLAEDAFRKTGLSPSHAVLLYTVNLRGEMEQKEIGELLHLTPSTITRLIDKLERQGYLKKQLHGKCICLQSTSEGLDMQEQIIASWNQLHKGYQDILTENETTQFLKTSSKLLEHLTDQSHQLTKTGGSDSMEEIFNRRSIRKFTNQPVEPEKIDKLLRAAMQAPSAANQQAWAFLVVQDKEKLAQLSEVSPYAKPVAGSAVTFVLLAEESKLKISSAWEQDLGAAAENMLLEAVHLGLGGVWFGIATSDANMENVRTLFQLPADVRPFALISVGYPDGQKNQFIDRYQADRVHYEKW